MLEEFKSLTEDERQLMFDAIPLITILVAAADDNLDEVEVAEAQRLADIRSYNNQGKLNAFYETIDEGLTARIRALAQELPGGLESRQQVLYDRLAKLNEVFPKLPKPYDYLYYHDFHTFAKHVAEAHGGLLRFFTVGPRERKVMDLPMITRVEKPTGPEYEGLF